MALNTKDDEAERLAGLRNLLEQEIWPTVPASMIGHGPSAEEQDAILGFGFPKTDPTLA